MEFSLKSGQPEKQRTACLIVPIKQGRHLGITAEKIDALSNGYLSELHKRGDIEGKVGQILLLPNVPGLSAERLLLIGCGNGGLKESQYREVISKIIQTLNHTRINEVIFFPAEIEVTARNLSWKIRQTIHIIKTSLYRFDEFKSHKDSNLRSPGRLIFIVPTRKELMEGEKALQTGVAIANAIEFTKNLANLPANVCTPAYLADKAKQFAKKHSKISAAILEEKEINSLGMRLLLSVAQGSNFPAKLITLEYRGGRKDAKPIIFVGKGITFDTGGNSMKLASNMIGMKYDMCGGASVFGVLHAAAELALPLNIIGIIPTCENMPGPKATRPEDIITSMAGLTVEILNTDAEGRLILADALTYCERFHPEVVIDIATLTGACVLALGSIAHGLMSNHEPLAKALLEAGHTSSDRAWQLPLWEDYHEALKSDFADLANVPTSDTGARTIVAGCFLAKFAQKFHWAHLDVANTACTSGAKRNATGRPVALLTQYLLDRCQYGHPT